MTGSSRTVLDQNAARAEFSGKLVTVNQQAIAEWAHDRPFPIGVILLRPPETKTTPAAPDHITTSGVCGSPAAGALAGRCGYGLRLPFLVISPWAKTNFVDHTLTDQTSSLRFIGRTGAWRPSTNSRNPTIKAPLTG
jgi:hypothetical protein